MADQPGTSEQPLAERMGQQAVTLQAAVDEMRRVIHEAVQVSEPVPVAVKNLVLAAQAFLDLFESETS